MRICENPKCGKEHNGSYGSGRFCSKHCRMAYIGSKCNKNGKLTGHRPFNKLPKAPYGTWKCKFCGLIFDTKRLLYKHYHAAHQEQLQPWHSKGTIPWNKGLTVKTDSRVAAGHQKLMDKYASGKLKGSWCGRRHTEETKKHLSEMALKSPHQRICKKTLPYTKTDGTVVNLDSSYERIVAEWLDKHNIEWIRPEPLNWKDSKGIIHHYFPDFYLPAKNVYIDPKNEYCFKAQSEKVSYIKEHYDNVIFLHSNELTNEYLSKLLLTID